MEKVKQKNNNATEQFVVLEIQDFFFNSSVVWAAEVTQPIVTAFLE